MPRLSLILDFTGCWLIALPFEKKTVAELRILLLEDSPADAEMNERVLRKAGIIFTSLRVETQETFIRAFEEFGPDLILSDYSLPAYSGRAALDYVQQTHPDIMLIMVTGAIGEEMAIELLKAGAKDYILKDRLARLPEAVLRVVEEKNLRQQRREAEEKFRKISESAQDAIIMMADKRISFWNAAAERIFGYTAAEAMGQELHVLLAPPQAQAPFAQGYLHFQESGEGPVIGKVLELTGMRKGGEEFPVELSVSATQLNGQWHAIGIARDITERKQAEERIRRLNRTLLTITACNENLVHAQSESDLLNEVCRNIVVMSGHLLAWVVYPGEGAQVLGNAAAHFGDEAAFLHHNELELDPEHARHCLTMAAMRERRTTICNQMQDMQEHKFESLFKLGVRAIMALPLLNDEQLYGVITVFSSTPNAFDVDEAQLMEGLAEDLAYGIDALRTTVDRDHYLSQFGQAMKNTITAIARTLEMRDPYTTGHQQRVTALSVAIAKEMGLDELLIEGLYFGAMIHDIGKIAVPAEILSKPSRLSIPEFKIIQHHAMAGYEIVQGIEFPWPIAEMIVQHHERLDGSGYPKGLKGDAIIIEARIIAVADVVEAMTTHRPYRPALGLGAALEEIEKGKGSRYDAVIADACIRVVKENGMKLPQL